VRPRRSLDPGDDGEFSDALVVIGAEEGIVVLEGDAAVGIAVRPEHVRMREQPGAAVDRFLATDRRQPQRRETAPRAASIRRCVAASRRAS
jgi:hypothetical protein